MTNEQKRIGRSPVFAIAASLLFLGGLGAAAGTDDDGGEKPFAEAEIFFELNDTDGDLGIHASIDGDAWKRLQIADPRDRTILDIRVQGRLRRQGLTQLFFESAEPPFDELAPEVFFQRFPEGEYEIEATTLDGAELESTAVLSHVMPAPPSHVLVSGVPAAESCDGVLPVVSPPIVISWAPVTESHPELGRPGPIEIVRYQLFVGELAVDLDPTVTSFDVPAEVLVSDGEFKFEIIAREASGNNTAVESCFLIE